MSSEELGNMGKHERDLMAGERARIGRKAMNQKRGRKLVRPVDDEFDEANPPGSPNPKDKEKHFDAHIILNTLGRAALANPCVDDIFAYRSNLPGRQRQAKQSPTSRAELLAVVETLIANVLHKRLLFGDKARVIISMKKERQTTPSSSPNSKDKEKHFQPTRYQRWGTIEPQDPYGDPFPAPATRVTEMVAAGWLTFSTKGKKRTAGMKERPLRSTIGPGPKLQKKLAGGEWGFWALKRWPGMEIVLKKPRTKGKPNENRLLEFPITNATYRLEAVMRGINDQIARGNITYSKHVDSNGEIVDTSAITLQRHFQEPPKQDGNPYEFNQLGRMFGAYWIELPEQDRKFIKIDGEETCQLDFSAFMPRVAAWEKSKGKNTHVLSPKFDPYVLPWFPADKEKAAQARKAMKKIYSALFFQPVEYFDGGRRYPKKGKKIDDVSPKKILEPLIAERKAHLVKMAHNEIDRSLGVKLRAAAHKARRAEDRRIMEQPDLLFLLGEIEKHLKCPGVFDGQPGFRINFKESEIVINAMMLAQGHHKKYPNKMVTLPVHDCLVCKKKDAKTIKKLMQVSSKAIIKSPLPLPVK